jgi:hypothetical protein
LCTRVYPIHYAGVFLVSICVLGCLFQVLAQGSASSSVANFTLTYRDPNTGRDATTEPLPVDASAAEVSDAIGALVNCGPVRVTRSDHSFAPDGTAAAPYDGSGVGTAALLLEWRVTFLGHRERRNVPTLVATRFGVDGAAPVAVFEVQAGRGGGGDERALLSIVPALAAPTAPLAVNLTVVSTSELGVYWRAPQHSGGAPVTKYLVEWDKTSAQRRSAAGSAASGGPSYPEALAFSEVVSGGATQYQIRGLEEGQPYHVRVSAFSGFTPGVALLANASSAASAGFGRSGYGLAARSRPWSATPAPQQPHRPTNVTFQLSTPGLVDARVSPGEIPTQLDVAWRRPAVDSNTTQFAATDGGSAILYYHLEWDTDPYFHFGTPAGSYAARAISQNGSPLPCALANCTFALGAEVQVLRVYSGDGNTLAAGAYALASSATAGAATTACVNYDATYQDLETALNALLGANVLHQGSFLAYNPLPPLEK